MNKELQDKAWAVLPKEFREEVKALYAKARDMHNIYTSATCINNTESKAIDIWNGKMQVLRELFGEHNLTSDTETEEMLIISRKAVEEFYNKYLGDALQAVSRITLRKDINALFGGKCRVGEDDVIETKPKFKVGDKVKILSDGQTGTITSIKESPAPYFVIWDKPQGIAGGYLAESNIELYVEEKKFLVGDKVIISDDPRIGRNFRGYIGTVTFINSTDQRNVDLGNGVFACFHISHLAPYIELKQGSESAKNENNGNHIVGSEHNQLRIMVAAEVMQGMLANTNIIMSCGDLEDNQEYITKHAVEYSDDLLKKFGIIIIKKTEK